ncbi:hypothetical protein F4781DRAFT_403622 [Annulohypoxylon bovei var. microspora]|nr:hypothetical protein F4781DRAFT_403622 [Annulohypoxylon bovei var. microspora]
MASSGLSEGVSPIPDRISADLPSKIPPEEDESDWEYEYSTTETETFYVTLDLSKADFTSRDANAVNRPGYRGGEKVERAKMYLNRRMSPGNNIDLSSDNSGEEGEIPRVPKQKEPEPQPQPQPPEGAEDYDDHQVQIMELHSENPIISYKGRIYSGVWNENVGTELLLTKRDDDAPLPALRHLDHDVELLAASSARVAVKEIGLKPKQDALQRQRSALQPGERSALGSLVPPAERWSTRERIDQGNFLARLIALKQQKGETDDVTVIAKSAERPDRSKYRMDKLKGKQGHRGKFNLPHGRGPRRARGSDLLRTLSIREDEGEGESTLEEGVGGDADGSGGSTPTPRRWEDLEEQGGGEDEEGEDEQGEEEQGEEEQEEAVVEEGGEGEDDEVVMMNCLDEEGENEEDENEEDEDSDSSGSGSDDSAEEMDLDEM